MRNIKLYYFMAIVACVSRAQVVDAGDASMIRRIAVDIHDRAPGLDSEWVAMARRCIFVHEGETFDPAGIGGSVEALRAGEQFASVAVDTIRGDDGVAVTFKLVPAIRVRKIAIHGAFPLFESDILKVLSIHSGSVLSSAELEDQKKRVVDLYRDDGYSTPTVEISRVDFALENFCDISITIRHGASLRLRQFSVTGNQRYPDHRIRLLCRSWRRGLLPGGAGRFVADTLKSDIRSLVDRYRRRGFAACTIDEAHQVDSAEHRIDVTLNINEGALTRIALSGNNRVGARGLRKKLTMFKEGDRNGTGVRKGIRQLSERYRSIGFVHPVITASDSIVVFKGTKERRIVFEIIEGPRPRVGAIAFTGNRSFTDAVLARQMATRTNRFFKQDDFDKDRDAIALFYLSQGYTDMTLRDSVVWKSDSTSLAVTYSIDEGRAWRIASCSFEGLTALSDAEARRTVVVREKDPYSNQILQTDAELIAQKIAAKGYPYVKAVAETRFDTTNAAVHVIYRIDQGPPVRTGAIFFSGNFKTKSTYLKRTFTLKPGEPFSLTEFLRAQKDIRNLEILNSASIRTIGLKEREPEVTMFVSVEERKPYVIEAGGGYQAESFFGNVKLGNRNLFGKNKSAFVSGQLSQIARGAQFELTEPSLFGSHTAASVNLYIENERGSNLDFGVFNIGSLVGIKRRIGTGITLNTSVRLERRNQVGDTTHIPGITRNSLLVTPSLTIDKRDSFVRPTRGIFVFAQCDAARGVNTALDNFIRFKGDLSLYATPVRWVTFAVRGRAWFIQPFGGGNILTQDRLFFLGGSASVRGFEENLLEYTIDAGKTIAAGRPAATLANIESRFNIGKNIEFSLFFDTGHLSYHLLSGNLRSAGGAGLRYITPVGPVGIAYGRKINPRPGESPGRFHFSIGYMF
jgi:outer membrane protein insertion porin family